MKRFPTVESVMTKVKFSQSRLENYLNNSSIDDQGLRDKIANDFETIACQSILTIAKGYVQVVFAKHRGSSMTSVVIPASAHFLVTAIRTYRRPYRVAFAVSLS